MARLGLEMWRGTMANWYIKCALEYFQPVYALMHGLFLQREAACQAFRERRKSINLDKTLILLYNMIIRTVYRRKEEEEMKKYQELRFTDDFMFCKVMTANPDLCRRVLSLLLGKEVRKIEMHGMQQTVDITAGGKGIRMDVYLSGEETVYDMEMQAASKPCLPKRLRYYQAMLDLNHLESGMDYRELPHTVIIFICTFDFFGKRLPVYTFENRCVQQPEISMRDGAEKMFVNPASMREGLESGMNAFLDYLEGKGTAGGLTGEIEEAVEKARRHKEWEVEYMTWQAYQMDARREGWEEGLEQGREEGLEQGEKKLGKLMAALLSQGLLEEAQRASEDAQARTDMYEKYGIS